MTVNEMKEFISKIVRKWKAYRYNVPFRNKVWYNYIAMIPRSEWGGKDYIEIFDEDGRYIDCPNIGGLVKYRYKGSLYLYKIVDFKNERRNKDWLHYGDWINPVIEFVSKV